MMNPNAAPPDDCEPKTLREAYLWVKPRWLRRLGSVVGIPIGIVWIYGLFRISKGDLSFFDSRLAHLCEGAFGILVALEMFFILRAYWRMDI